MQNNRNDGEFKSRYVLSEIHNVMLLFVNLESVFLLQLRPFQYLIFYPSPYTNGLVD